MVDTDFVRPDKGNAAEVTDGGIGSCPRDTSPEAWEKQREVHARLGPQGRLEAAFEASELVRQIAVAGIRSRHPELTEEEARIELMRRMYGKDLLDRAVADRDARRSRTVAENEEEA